MKQVFLAAYLGIVCSMSLAHALNLPGVVPPGTNWDTWWNRTTPGTCGGATWNVYALDTTAARDFNATEKAAQKTAFLTTYKNHCSYVSEATYTYNCHGYVFDSSNHWGGDPANWEGAMNPCYQVDATGPVYRWGGTHSAFGGSGYTYLGKCGREIRCNHDDAVYGAHTNRWRQRPAS